MYIIHYSCWILMKLDFSRQIFEKISTIKFHHNPSSGSRVVTCGLTDMTKLIVAFRNFANPLKAVHFADTTCLCVSCVWNHGHRLCRYFSINRLVFNKVIYSLTMNLRVLCTYI
jgi:hypothetical protein